METHITNEVLARRNVIKSQKLRLYGKGDLIDKWGRFYVHYDFAYDGTKDETKIKLDNISAFLPGKSPLRFNGFFINLRYAKLFAPKLTTVKEDLLGHKLSILASIKTYEYTIDDIPHIGWTIYPQSIHIV